MVVVRDSGQQSHGVVLRYTAAAWDSFVKSIKLGLNELDGR
jgi:hypothetical protein